MKTLIITACVGYNDNIKNKFIANLKNVGFSGDVEVLNWTRYSNEFFTERIKAYYEKINSVINSEYKTIITSDIRDVIFQKNPDNIQHSDLDFFLEDESMTITACPFNSVWIRDGFGKEWLDKIGHNNISCAGVVIGKPENILCYYKKMQEISSSKHANDQGIHNFLLYSGQINARIIKNDDGEVYTIGYTKKVVVNNHIIYNKNGKIPAIVHQYDRHFINL